MKYSPALLTALLAFLLVAATLPGNLAEWTITSESQMWVDGTSTIHDWTCDVNEVQGSVTMDLESGQVSQAVVTVPSEAIECESGTMNRKVDGALSIDEYPTIRFSLTSANVTQSGDDLQIDAVGTLELAGATNEVSASLTGQPAADGAYRFTGSVPITMSTFDIDPPTAMFGALKTGDDVTVRFELVAAPSGDLSSSQ